jgi:hypothetical protein
MNIKPFSILDSRTKEWQDRKRWWVKTYGIKSELGREDTESKSKFWETDEVSVSIFDATLCELMYSWFSPKGGKVLDPFAGGSVRGIIAEEMGYGYTGIDISKTQIEANRLQSSKPTYLEGDSEVLLETVIPNHSVDYIFTCPPYYDLEVYSDNPNDLSNLSVEDFDIKYRSILKKSVDKLKDNRFFTIVLSEVREQSTTGNYKIGKYKGLVWKTIQFLEECGLSFYNDMVLFNSQHQASRVVDTYFDRNRKVASVHQNILVFVKGNPDIATELIKNGDNFVCRVNGNLYRSFREAAIDIDPNELVASEVERRCLSTKSKYKEWQIIGEETKPTIRYQIDGIPFESPKQIMELIGGDITENQIRGWIDSNNPQWRHWMRVEPTDWDITYEEMEILWGGDIHFELPVIECDGREFLSQKDAAEFFGISSERVRQKLNSDKYPNWKYLF